MRTQECGIKPGYRPGVEPFPTGGVPPGKLGSFLGEMVGFGKCCLFSNNVKNVYPTDQKIVCIYMLLANI